MKTCTACGEQKPLSDYYLEKGKPRAKCKDCHKATAYKRRDADRDAYNEWRREYTKNNPEKINAKAREYRERHGEKINARRRQLRAEDEGYAERQREHRRNSNARTRDKIAERNRDYYDANSHKWAAMRAKRQDLIDQYEPINRMDIYKRDGGRCRLCNIALAPHEFELDHIVPLALEGPHVWSNVQVLCKPCNRRKHARLDGQIHLPV